MKRKRRTRFVTWCKRDPDDERKINYEFTDCNGHQYVFTSEDEVDLGLFRKISQAWIKNIELVDNEWYAVLYED